jgi:hypothetical protein
MNCYAAAAAMSTPVEAGLVEGLNTAIVALKADGQLPPELAALSTEFIPR